MIMYILCILYVLFFVFLFVFTIISANSLNKEDPKCLEKYYLPGFVISITKEI